MEFNPPEKRMATGTGSIHLSSLVTAYVLTSKHQYKRSIIKFTSKKCIAYLNNIIMTKFPVAFLILCVSVPYSQKSKFPPK